MPSYNLQLVTEGKNGFVAGWSVTTSTNDLHELPAALAVEAKRYANAGANDDCRPW